jgi:hypothetical protein
LLFVSFCCCIMVVPPSFEEWLRESIR